MIFLELRSKTKSFLLFNSVVVDARICESPFRGSERASSAAEIHQTES